MTISFTKVRLPNGWLSNMSPHPVRFAGTGLVYPTAEHLFQAMRFSPEDPLRDEIIRVRSPMAAKMLARKHDDQMVVKRCASEDVHNMRVVLHWKAAQHPDLLARLLETNCELIVEDVTRRASRGSALFWGAALAANGKWYGENMLGKLWMELRQREGAARRAVRYHAVV